MTTTQTQTGTTSQNDQWTNRIQVQSTSSDRIYTLAQNRRTGEWGCSCPAWRFRRTCKHVRSLTSGLMAVVA